MIDGKSEASTSVEDDKLKDYVLKTVSYTSLTASLIFLCAYIYDRATSKLFNLLFPFVDSSYPDIIGLVWFISVLLLFGFSFNKKYRSKTPLVILLYLYAFLGLATLTTAVIASGGIEYSPFSAFFPVAVSINIMSTSSDSKGHRFAFLLFAILAVLIAMKYNISTFIDPISDPTTHGDIMSRMTSETHQIVYYLTFSIAILIGFIAGLIKRKSHE